MKELEFDRIKELWKEYALTEAAKQKIEELECYLSEAELEANLRETTEARLLLEKAGQPPLVSLSGQKELLALAKAGGCLTAEQIETIGESLTAMKRLKEYLKRCMQYPVSLPYYGENIDFLSEVKEAILLAVRHGQIEDAASKLLRNLREEIARADAKMREKADSLMRQYKECMSDSFSTMRNGHICIPVKKECKFKIRGTVIDKSATGNTLFMEPAESARYYEELQLLQIEAENEERRILYALTALVADHAETFEQNATTAEKLDFIFSKGKLSLSMDGVEPRINTARRIVIEDGRHPLMEKARCVPLQFRIGDGINGVVITGPNTGGKTVAIKTVALTCMMAQCGLHVACREADLCMNSNYLCDIGDGQSLSENLSTFSAHILKVLEILKQVNRESLVILDELGSGTDPTEGMGLAIAILEELKKSGALFLVTTHYPEVKQYAERGEGIINARMTFDKESLKPLYRLVIGEAGESCAFYIAQKLGMPREMLLCAAKEAYGQKAEEKAGELLKEQTDETEERAIRRVSGARIEKKKQPANTQSRAKSFRLGDSVILYPEKKVAIVCRTADDKGRLQVQLAGKKLWVNHKRIKLHVAAEELYPEDYDFSIVFESVKNRKLKHKMERKCVEETLFYEEDER